MVTGTTLTVKREHCDTLTASHKGWLLCLGHTNHVPRRVLLQHAQRAAHSPCIRFASNGRIFGPLLRIRRPDQLYRPMAICKTDRHKKPLLPWQVGAAHNDFLTSFAPRSCETCIQYLVLCSLSRLFSGLHWAGLWVHRSSRAPDDVYPR